MELLKICDNDRIFVPSNDDMIRLINPLLLVMSYNHTSKKNLKQNCPTAKLNHIQPITHCGFGRGVVKASTVKCPGYLSFNQDHITEKNLRVSTVDDLLLHMDRDLSECSNSDAGQSSCTAPVGNSTFE